MWPWGSSGLPHTGQAVIIDLGDAADIHPRNKVDVAKRLARLALARDYNRDVVSQSPRYDRMQIDGDRILIRFQDVDKQLQTKDNREAQGFAIAGDDRKWHPANAEIIDKDWVAVHSDDVKEPVAVRYAWADNPVCTSHEWLSLLATFGQLTCTTRVPASINRRASKQL